MIDVDRRALPWWCYVLIAIVLGLPLAAGAGWVFDTTQEQYREWKEIR